MDRHRLLLLGRGAGALLGFALLLHYWFGAGREAGNNLFLNGAILVSLIVAIFDDRLVVHPGALAAARFTACAGLFGLALATFS